MTGNNSNFNGSIRVHPDATLEARAQSLPPILTNNGLVLFNQPDVGSYAGTISGIGQVGKMGGGVLTLSGPTPTRARRTFRTVLSRWVQTTPWAPVSAT